MNGLLNQSPAKAGLRRRLADVQFHMCQLLNQSPAKAGLRQFGDGQDVGQQFLLNQSPAKAGLRPVNVGLKKRPVTPSKPVSG